MENMILWCLQLGTDNTWLIKTAGLKPAHANNTSVSDNYQYLE